MDEQNSAVESTTWDTAPAAETVDWEARAAELAAEKNELQDRYLRRSAEFENFRRRTEREREELLQYASMEAVRSLLPVLDDFERALQAECADAEYAKGVQLIYQRTRLILEGLGLEPVEALGQKFDPHQHHAIDRRPTGEVEEDTVLEELQRGYRFRGRLLRPAMVRVAVAPASQE